MNGCKGSYKATDFYTDRQLTAMFCPVHTQPKQPYKLTDKHSREFKEGDFQRGQTQRGGAALLCGSPFDPVPKARPAQTAGSGKTNQTRTDYPDNIQHYLPPRRESIFTHDRANVMSDYANRVQRHAAAPRECMHAQSSECKRAITRTWVQRHAASVRARTSVDAAAPWVDFWGGFLYNLGQ